MTKNNERIFITGAGGVGKTTYAKKLCVKKNLSPIQLDDLKYPAGEKIPEQDFRQKVKEVVSLDSWIIEGTPKNTLDIILPRCTKIIVLSAPRSLCSFRVLKRILKEKLNIEKSKTVDSFKYLFSKDFIVFWVWRNYPRYIKQIEKALEDTPHNAEVVKRKI